MSAFKTQLQHQEINANEYLNLARNVAINRGYNPALLSFADDKTHKLNYNGVKFGRIGYNDKLIYAILEEKGKLPQGTTLKQSTNYRKRAMGVMQNTNNRYSPASLSYYILW
jgi:hypothetical protein